ncbi:MAG: ATP-binding protein [Clostridia bacterium]
MAADDLRIAILSGKGGTGKTFLAVNITAVTKNSGYMDCDVEEPNGHLFFKPVDVREEEVRVSTPVWHPKTCTACRRCVDFCRFNALAYAGKKVIVFEDICHSCRGCMHICPEQAFTEKQRTVGKILRGNYGGKPVITGMLQPGMASGVPVIRQMMQNMPKNLTYTIIDCPPGSACTVMESIRKADYCLLVMEPTLFGMHDFGMVANLLDLFGKPHGAVINKSTGHNEAAYETCRQRGIRVLGDIPFDRHLGTLHSNGIIAAEENGEYREMFLCILREVAREAGK